MNSNNIYAVIKYSLWGTGIATANYDTFEELKRHAIAALPTNCLQSLEVTSELEIEWKRYIIQQYYNYTQYIYEQTRLPISVPYVILKGTSAAKYYPHPEYRVMGDIDIMTRREDFDIACKELLENGYRIGKDIEKEASFSKNGICIDLHRQFASLNDPLSVKYLDDLIIENINPTHVLPDPINGLVLLEHINQHLEGGLGLRQIIDWMMFVNKYLSEEKWPEFFEYARKIGLEKLALVCTRMCEMYLGLPHREWCSKADAGLCKQLMEYVTTCGNFGNKKVSDEELSKNVFAYASTTKTFFRLLQRRGLINWKSVQRHRILRPFAWIYQAFRYASRGLKRDQATSSLFNEYKAAKERNKMFDALGVKTAAKGIVIYKNGNYIKE